MQVFKANNTPNGLIVNNQTLNDVLSLSGQKTVSEGFLLMHQNQMLYLANSITDIKSMIDVLLELIPKINTASLQPSPTWAVDSATFITKLNTIKENLK